MAAEYELLTLLGPGGPIVATAVGSVRDGCSLSASASRDYSARRTIRGSVNGPPAVPRPSGAIPHS